MAGVDSSNLIQLAQTAPEYAPLGSMPSTSIGSDPGLALGADPLSGAYPPPPGDFGSAAAFNPQRFLLIPPNGDVK